MKKLMFSAIMMATILMACQSNNAKSEAQADGHNHVHDETHAHDESHEGNESEAMNNGPKTAAINDLVDGYLKLKNALTKDDTKTAANIGKEMASVVSNVDESKFTEEQKVAFSELMDDTKEHFEHIGANAGEISHQREHFAMLSQNMSELIDAFGSELTLYKDHCPMYDDGNGAIWISEMKDIKNPYYGKKMLTCGKMQEEL